MTYNVFSGTLNPTHSLTIDVLYICFKLTRHAFIICVNFYTMLRDIITGRMLQGICWYLDYSGDFQLFAPQGRLVASMGVKFGTEESTNCQI